MDRPKTPEAAANRLKQLFEERDHSIDLIYKGHNQMVAGLKKLLEMESAAWEIVFPINEPKS
jgi:hypothetical protein